MTIIGGLVEQVMSAVGLVLYLAFMVLAFGVRAIVHRRRTGSAGFNGMRGRPGSAEWIAGALFVVAVVAGLVAPALQAFGVVAPVAAVDGWFTRVAGVVVAVAGIAATLWAQGAMGDSWRVGVDPDETTGLVTTGPFGVVRNPIFTTMTVAGLGLTLLAPNAVAIGALAVLVVAVESQVRVVEEPYLIRTHGEAYLTYARRVGRLVPGVGRAR
ncbi:methyltransferase family protein [Actinophytocola sp. NPDC049390]|uniref:methyltransferase family protein n=1 Tax=Actinophytocola sp. NPDC049390 TaxID=3363894 RepID=UPI00378E4E80